MSPTTADLPFDEGFRLAREAAARAVELDENLAEGWAALGLVKTFYDRDWAGAEVALGRARALAPSNAGVLVALPFCLRRSARIDWAIAFARRAVKLDPLSTAANRTLGVLLTYTGHFQEAEAASRKVLELQPGNGFEHTCLGLIELLRSRPEAVLAEIEKEKQTLWRLYGLALVYHALGRGEEADAAYRLAEIHAYRGEPDAAFEWLERAYSNRDPGLTWVKSTPLLADLHDDPRWPVFLEQMGLPE